MGVYATIAQGGTQRDPFSFLNSAIGLGRQSTALRQQQFDLQQQQQQLAYGRLNALRGTPGLSYDMINQALGSAQRMGADTTPFAQDIASATAAGISPQEYVRQLGMGVAPPGLQYEAMQPQPFEMQTGQGTYFGYQGGPGSAIPFVPTPFGFASRGFTPGEATDMQIVGYNPDGSPRYQPRGVTYGQPYGAPMGAGGAGTTGPAPANLAPLIHQASAKYGIPEPVLTAMFSQESSLGGASPNIGQITAETAAKPGFGMQPISQQDINDPAKNIDFSAQYLRARGDAAGVQNWNDPSQVALALEGYNGGGDPNYVRNVFGRMAFAPYQVASAGPNVPGPPGGFTGGMVLPPSPGTAAGAGGAAGGGGYTGYSGLPTGFAQLTQAQIDRQQAMEAQMNKAIDARATLQGMETELSNMPTSGIAAGPLATLKNAIVSSGFANQQTVDEQSKGLAAQEQFEKFSSLLNQQLLTGMGGQPTDARQELTGASTPSSIHSKLGNLGIIHMLEGNITALQVMGRSFRQAVGQGQASPQQFDTWRDNFTAPTKDGSRFDPRVFWIANMGGQEQQDYVNSLSPKDKTQLLKNANFAEQQGWVYENPDHTMGTGF